MTEIDDIVSAQRASFKDASVSAAVARLGVQPYKSVRAWDYGEPGERFCCWIIAESRKENLAVAYCERGFGPEHPWGVILHRGDDFQMSMGMDSDWFGTLEEVFTRSWAARRLVAAEKEPNHSPQPTTGLEPGRG